MRIDNFVPIVVSTSPSNGSIVASANVITVTASEDIASVTGGTLDGAPAVMPMLSGAVATFNVGSLSDGAHTLEGTIYDAAGKSSAFSITFMVGVPAPAPSTGGGTFGTGPAARPHAHRLRRQARGRRLADPPLDALARRLGRAVRDPPLRRRDRDSDTGSRRDPGQPRAVRPRRAASCDRRCRRRREGQSGQRVCARLRCSRARRSTRPARSSPTAASLSGSCAGPARSSSRPPQR